MGALPGLQESHPPAVPNGQIEQPQ